jgi:uncharacterized membrane protein HdeD (DUF308 family)
MASKEEIKLAEQMWALVVAEGVAAVLFGIAMLFWPGASLVILVVLFGIFVLVWGIMNLIHSILSIGKMGTWWIELIFSVLAVGLGVYLLRNPGVTLALFIVLIGCTFIIRGVIDLVLAFFSDNVKVKGTRALHVVTGILGVVAGIFVFSQPVASGVAFIWVVGLYAVLEGALLIAIALKERSLLGK